MITVFNGRGGDKVRMRLRYGCVAHWPASIFVGWILEPVVAAAFDVFPDLVLIAHVAVWQSAGVWPCFAGFSLPWIVLFLLRFEVALDGCDGLHDGVDVRGGLDLDNEKAHGRDHGLDQRLRHGVIFCGADTDKCFPEVIAKVCRVLADVVGPCCHLRPRCRHGYVTLANVYKLRLLTWSRGGLLDVILVAQFQEFRSHCL